jgi:hypothetical protein
MPIGSGPLPSTVVTTGATKVDVTVKSSTLVLVVGVVNLTCPRFSAFWLKTNLDLMASGLQKHSQLYGDANTKRYQQMWSSNADSRIFELMNIARDVKDEKTRMAMSNKLLSGLNDEQRQQLTKQYQNILKLSKTGEL